MNTLKEILTVCGVAGIGFFFGYVLGFVEGKAEGKKEGNEKVKSKSEEVKSEGRVKSGRGVTSGREESRKPSVEDASAHPSHDIDLINEI